MVLYYRKDLFKQKGIKEADLATWDKLYKTGKKLAKNDQKLLALDWSYFEILLRQRGSDFFDDKGKPFCTCTTLSLSSSSPMARFFGGSSAENPAECEP